MQNITSIDLTAGVWDISALSVANYSSTSTGLYIGISDTSGTIVGNPGDQYNYMIGAGAVGSNYGVSVPAWRVVLVSTTTYYLVVQPFFSAGTGTGYGRISAVRVA